MKPSRQALPGGFCISTAFSKERAMNEPPARHPIALKKVVYEIPGMASAVVRRDVPYRTAGEATVTMDLYYPSAAASGATWPATVAVLGYPPREPNPLGCAFKEMEWSVSWGRLIAASGIVAIFYTNRNPEADLRTLLGHIREHAESLGIDRRRIGLFATSGSGPLALSALIAERGGLACAALCYPLTLDAGGSTAVAESAAKWGFVNPTAGKSASDLPRDVPLFVARAGQDEFPHLNEALDRFVADTLARDLPMTMVNHAGAPHAFDLVHDSDATREIIRQLLRFLQFHLRV
jgi:dienelactone hydrolase